MVKLTPRQNKCDTLYTPTIQSDPIPLILVCYTIIQYLDILCAMYQFYQLLINCCELLSILIEGRSRIIEVDVNLLLVIHEGGLSV